MGCLMLEVLSQQAMLFFLNNRRKRREEPRNPVRDGLGF